MQVDTQVPASDDPFRVEHSGFLMPMLWYAPLKVVADIVLATVLLVLLSPVILLLLLLVKCTSRGPAYIARSAWDVIPRPSRSTKSARCPTTASATRVPSGPRPMTPG